MPHEQPGGSEQGVRTSEADAAAFDGRSPSAECISGAHDGAGPARVLTMNESKRSQFELLKKLEPTSGVEPRTRQLRISRCYLFLPLKTGLWEVCGRFPEAGFPSS